MGKVVKSLEWFHLSTVEHDLFESRFFFTLDA